MSTIPHEAASATEQPLTNLLFDHPGADITLGSQESSLFRVPKLYIIDSSPILSELIRRTLDSPSNPSSHTSLPVVQLPERGEIIHCLLTFIFPITPRLPPTPEEIMELLSVAQKYQMETALTHIRGSIALRNSLSIRPDSALHIYALAQKYGLRPEALQAARVLFLKQSMNIEDFGNKIDIMPGAYLYELWKYHESVQAILASDLTEFTSSGGRGTLAGFRCMRFSNFSPSQISSWLDYYIISIEISPNLFDLIEFNAAMARHIKNFGNGPGCECSSIPSQTIREFWEAFTSVVDGSFEKAEPALSLARDQEDPQAQIDSTTSLLKPFDVPDPNIIIRSSDFVDFRVHKQVLAIASPFFKVLLSLPQPPDSESVDGIPVVQLSESSELLNSLISMLYPMPAVKPNSYEKVLYLLVIGWDPKVISDFYYKMLYLLAACQKYEMASVQSSIRAEVSRGEFPAPNGAEAFTAYAIASAKELSPEMENAARLTLDLPMTFEILGEGLRLFEGWALRNLVNFRRRCRDNLIACLDLYIEVQPFGPSSIWVGCPEVMPASNTPRTSRQNSSRVLPRWLNQLLSRNKDELKREDFFHYPLDIHSTIRQKYFSGLQNHASCNFCLGVHMRNGSTFCSELEEKLVHARNKVAVISAVTPV